MRQELEGIYRRHRQGLFTLALTITRCPQRAEDAVQEAFVRLWKLPSPPPGDATAYTFASVRNAAIDQVRRRPPEDLPPAASIFDGRAETPPAAAIRNEERQSLQRAVEDLPPEQREAIVMKVYGELTFEQIAQVLGEPMQTVASRYRRALQRLRENMPRSS